MQHATARCFLVFSVQKLVCYKEEYEDGVLTVERDVEACGEGQFCASSIFTRINQVGYVAKDISGLKSRLNISIS